MTRHGPVSPRRVLTFAEIMATLVVFETERVTLRRGICYTNFSRWADSKG